MCQRVGDARVLQTTHVTSLHIETPFSLLVGATYVHDGGVVGL